MSQADCPDNTKRCTVVDGHHGTTLGVAAQLKGLRLGAHERRVYCRQRSRRHVRRMMTQQGGAGGDAPATPPSVSLGERMRAALFYATATTLREESVQP